MGQALSCRATQEHELFGAVQLGDLETVEALLEEEPALIHQITVYDRLSALHIAAANGQIEVIFLVFILIGLLSFSLFLILGCVFFFGVCEWSG